MMQRTALVLILMSLATGAQAQIIYRSTMPDGRTVLSDRPTPGAKTVQEIHTPKPPPQPGAAARVPGIGVPAAPPKPDAKAAVDAAMAELRAATEALATAQAARNAGQEPLPGERQGVVGGGSRLTEPYFNRQAPLDAMIAQAQKRVDDAQAKVNSLR